MTTSDVAPVDWAGVGAANNARWCDRMTVSHGGAGQFADDAWTSPTRTPPLYPDAVTLTPSLDIADLLARIDIADGCTIKDSFATVDLAPHGFRVLFDAEWIAAPARSALPQPAPLQPAQLPPEQPASSAVPGWTRIADADGLSRWEEAWAEEPALPRLFLPELLLDDSVAIVACVRGDRIAAGAVLYRDADVAGVSNVFTRAGSPTDTWTGLMQYAQTNFTTMPLVGYESGQELVHALSVGFRSVGPLRVWIADG